MITVHCLFDSLLSSYLVATSTSTDSYNSNEWNACKDSQRHKAIGHSQNIILFGCCYRIIRHSIYCHTQYQTQPCSMFVQKESPTLQILLIQRPSGTDGTEVQWWMSYVKARGSRDSLDWLFETVKYHRLTEEMCDNSTKAGLMREYLRLQTRQSSKPHVTRKTTLCK